MVQLEELRERAAKAPTVRVERDRYGYRVDGNYLRRVTTLLGGIPKDWMGRWVAKEISEYAVKHREQWQELPPTDAVKLLKGVPWTRRDDAADRGSAIHDAIDAHLKGKDVPEFEHEEELLCAQRAQDFLEARGSKVLGSEITVFSPKHGYAGTFDLWDVLAEESWVLDWKTSKWVYPEYAVQLSAYRHAEFAFVQSKPVGDGRAEVWEGRVIEWGPEMVDRTGVVHVTPEKAVLYPVIQSERLWTVFRAAAHVKLWTGDTDDYKGRAREPVFESPTEEVGS